MNVFTIPSQQIAVANLTSVNKDLLRSLALGLFYGENQTFTIDAGTTTDTTNFSFEADFSLSNMNVTGQVFQSVYSSQHQQTIENFDKPVIETNDLVLSLVLNDGDKGGLKRFYNEYREIKGLFTCEVNGNPVSVSVFVGLSNSSKSEFNDPFANFTHIVFKPEEIENSKPKTV